MGRPRSGWKYVPPAPGDGANGRTVPEWLNPDNLKFLILQAPEGKQLNVNPFIIGKTIKNYVGEVDSGYPIEKGTKYMVKVRSEVQFEKLQKLKKLITGEEIVVEPHGTLNSSKCVVTCREVSDMTEEEICSELSDQKVTNVKRFAKKIDGQLHPTNTLLLTLNSPTIPEKMNFGLLKIETRPYYPSPMLCRRCFAYGHTAARCTNHENCDRCSETAHGECGSAAKCRNCGGSHPASSRSCPIFLDEQAIIKIKTDHKITYNQAKAKHNATKVSAENQVSYAQTTDTTTQDKLFELIAELHKEIQELKKKLTKTTSESSENETESTTTTTETDSDESESNDVQMETTTENKLKTNKRKTRPSSSEEDLAPKHALKRNAKLPKPASAQGLSPSPSTSKAPGKHRNSS